jgi:hypothetical protein
VNPIERTKAIFDAARRAQSQPASHVAIPVSRAPDAHKLGTPFEPNEHYFQVRVNEMFLTHKRKWLTEQYPMVFAQSEFLYGTQSAAEMVVPFVVGPSLLGTREQDAIGMTFGSTRVAGIHPYRGGRVTLSLILYRVPAGGPAQNLLGMVENMAGALSFSSTIGPYTKLAGALLDGVEMLTAMDKTAPVMSHRIEIDRNAGDDLEPGYFALVDVPEEQLASAELWVVGGKLRQGPDLAHLKPFRDADYVLYSLATTAKRDDFMALPVYALWSRIVREAGRAQDDAFTVAKANLASFCQDLLLSPDLTPSHARELSASFRAQLREINDEAVAFATLGDDDDEQARRRRALYDTVVNDASIDAPASEAALAAVRDDALAALDL